MNRIMSRLGTVLPLLALVGTAGIAGCKKPQPPKTPTAQASPAASSKPAEASPDAGALRRGDTETPQSGSVQIDKKILTLCGNIPEARFAFNSSSIEGAAADALGALARCFVDGPLKGRGMKLVGHTDPQGPTSYNYGLGQRRADSVSAYLQSKKLLASQVATSSVGENDASGTDEQGWAKDRRVDVFLAE